MSRIVGPFSRLTRRTFLGRTSLGLGAAALSCLLGREARARPLPHFAPKAKACICFYLEGAPSQIDLFDPKPKLNELNGQKLPDSMTDPRYFNIRTMQDRKLA